MPKAILYRNDEYEGRSKSTLVYRNFEAALCRMAQAEGRELHSDFDPHSARPPRKGTVYKSVHSVVSIGITAHERLANVVRTSLLYLDPSPHRISDAPDVAKLLDCVGPSRTTSRVVLLGQRARQASILLAQDGADVHELPPLDVTRPGADGPASDRNASPRLTIVNHLRQDRLARTIVDRFLESSTFAIDVLGLPGERHNRVRYLSDAAVGDTAPGIHVHVGAPQPGGDRLRICDSWQSSAPVIYFNCGDNGQRPRVSPDLHHEANVMVCETYGKAYEFISFLMETPNLYRQLADGGRAAAAPAARAWDELARELAA